MHISAPRVYDLQVSVVRAIWLKLRGDPWLIEHLKLFAWYIAMSPVPHALHSVIGYGIRLAKDLGVHRRGTYSSQLTVEDELKKRAFWSVHVI